MEVTFAELLIVLAVGAGLYALLKPLQARIEASLRRFFDPNQRDAIDVEVVPEPPRKKKKDSKDS